MFDERKSYKRQEAFKDVEQRAVAFVAKKRQADDSDSEDEIPTPQEKGKRKSGKRHKRKSTRTRISTKGYREYPRANSRYFREIKPERWPKLPRTKL